jgi:hypothetical protein
MFRSIWLEVDDLPRRRNNDPTAFRLFRAAAQFRPSTQPFAMRVIELPKDPVVRGASLQSFATSNTTSLTNLAEQCTPSALTPHLARDAAAETTSTCET